MIPKHYSELNLLPGFHSKPWLIAGTGPTLLRGGITNFNPDDYNIWAINLAGNAFRSVFVWSLTDFRAVEEINHSKFLNKETIPKAILTRSINLSRFEFIHDLLTFLNDILNISKLPNIEEILYFIEYDQDFHNSIHTKPLFKNHPLSPCGCSSASAVRILGELGVKQIFTTGIDGGIGVRHPMFDKIPSTQITKDAQIDYTLHNAGMDHWANVYGIEIIKL
jgi:hypothetical protein